MIVTRRKATNRYNLENKQIVRPFYPGGDYVNYDYTDDMVVIDNPPFSIISKIVSFYEENNIKYFLFAPGLTPFSGCKKFENQRTYIIVDKAITYENGAVVPTAFITNLEEDSEIILRMDKDLNDMILEWYKNNLPSKKKKGYDYKNQIITAANLQKISRVKNFNIYKEEVSFTRKAGKEKIGIFGAGFYVSEPLRNEINELSEKYKYNILNKKEDEKIPLTLSEEEIEIVNNLTKNHKERKRD